MGAEPENAHELNKADQEGRVKMVVDEQLRGRSEEACVEFDLIR